MPTARLSAVDISYLQLACRKNPDTDQNMVMIHGLAANQAFWHVGAATAFAAHCRVMTYDLRGHGRSSMPARGYTVSDMVRDLYELLDVLHIDTAHLVAHSFGGSVAVHFALRFPERVQSMILADVRLRAVQPSFKLREWNQWQAWKKHFVELGTEIDEDDPEGGYRILVHLAQLRAQGKKVDGEMKKLFAHNSKSHKSSRVAQKWLALQEQTSILEDIAQEPRMGKEHLHTLRQPVLALYGEHSPALKTGKVLRRQLPRCFLRIIPEAGHFFPLTQVQKLVRPGLTFLRAQQRIKKRAIEP